jgi:hypothetical protein
VYNENKPPGNEIREYNHFNTWEVGATANTSGFDDF